MRPRDSPSFFKRSVFLACNRRILVLTTFGSLGNVNGGKVVSSGLVTVPISFRSTALNRSAPEPSSSNGSSSTSRSDASESASSIWLRVPAREAAMTAAPDEPPAAGRAPQARAAWLFASREVDQGERQAEVESVARNWEAGKQGTR